MVVYEVFFFNPEGGYERIGVLPERRKNPLRVTRESILNWGKMLLGDNVVSKDIFFRRLIIDSVADKILWYDLSSDPKKIKS